MTNNYKIFSHFNSFEGIVGKNFQIKIEELKKIKEQIEGLEGKNLSQYLVALNEQIDIVGQDLETLEKEVKGLNLGDGVSLDVINSIQTQLLNLTEELSTLKVTDEQCRNELITLSNKHTEDIEAEKTSINTLTIDLNDFKTLVYNSTDKDEKEIANTSRIVSDHTNIINRTTDQIQSINESLSNIESDITSLNSKIEEQEKSTYLSDNKISEIETKLEEDRNNIESILGVQGSIKTQLNALQDENQNNIDQINTLLETTNDLGYKYENLSSQISIQEDTTNSQQELISQLRNDYEEFVSSTNEKLSDIISRISTIEGLIISHD